MRAPTDCGVLDWYLGGVQHTRADREIGRAIEQRFPSVREHARAAKDFHLRVAVLCTGRGISRFVRAGPISVLNPGRNVHDVVSRVSPAAEVLYVTRCPEAYSWAEALLSGVPRTAAVLCHPTELLGAVPVKELLRQGEPVCLIVGLAMHLWPADQAAGALRAYAEGLPRGSCVAVSLGLAGGAPGGEELAAMYAPGVFHRYTAADVTGWLEDSGLDVDPPGVRDVRLLPVRAAAALGGSPQGFVGGAIAWVVR